ncbi:MAG: L,D-transpeptidase family protein [Magnetococcales bacterium]|nr:L,D-transpeptidase family protein [Magnetococcales bacterium]
MYGIVTLLLGLLMVAPWPSPAMAASETVEVIGEGNAEHILTSGDTLAALARRFDLGYNALVLANPGVHPWLPEPGERVTLPRRWVLPESDGGDWEILVNQAELRLFRRRPGGGIDTYPVSIGKEAHATPLGRTTVVRKAVNPVWGVPDSVRREAPGLPARVMPGPDNPLGRYALYLGWPLYLIHGTNAPYGVGKRVTHGCLRLYPEDIERLFAATRVGDRVLVVEQPIKAGWWQGELHLEVHPPPSGRWPEGEAYRRSVAVIERAIHRLGGESTTPIIEWTRVEAVAAAATGIVTVVGRGPTPEHRRE